MTFAFTVCFRTIPRPHNISINDNENSNSSSSNRDDDSGGSRKNDDNYDPIVLK